MKDKQKTSQEEADQETPAWIVSFTDMITLLLAFFIMLQTLAVLQDPELFHVGRDSFKRAIAGLGIPDWLFGKPERPRFDYHKRKHTSSDATYDIPRNRLIDEEDAPGFARRSRNSASRPGSGRPMSPPPWSMNA